MKTICILILVCISVHLSAQYNNKNLTLAPEVTAEKLTYGNLRIYPVYANAEFTKSSGTEKYLSMKEAFDQKKMKIIEKSSEGAEVNTLYVQNNSNDTIMLLGGEVIEGGKQDRMVASDVIIPPGKGNKPLKVFCVEHGRWNTKSENANSFNFSPSKEVKMVSPAIKQAGSVEKNQSYVWSRVKEVTDKNGCTSNTQAYTSLKADSTFQKSITGYQKFFTSAIKSDPKIIGVVYATAKRVLGCDLFASHELLLKHSENLISSYSTEATSHGDKVTISYASVKSYTDKFLADEKNQDKVIYKNGTILKQGEKKVHIATY